MFNNALQTNLIEKINSWIDLHRNIDLAIIWRYQRFYRIYLFALEILSNIHLAKTKIIIQSSHNT